MFSAPTSINLPSNFTMASLTPPGTSSTWRGRGSGSSLVNANILPHSRIDSTILSVTSISHASTEPQTSMEARSLSRSGPTRPDAEMTVLAARLLFPSFERISASSSLTRADLSVRISYARLMSADFFASASDPLSGWYLRWSPFHASFISDSFASSFTPRTSYASNGGFGDARVRIPRIRPRESRTRRWTPAGATLARATRIWCQR
mmetsp:Transcript_1626/g.7211  ORF Transcript_1626/g.7211 Transcript_1626/m.7211 type:complete len:207 (+) Transcript_1626:3015-3635(+)